jgi:hypothetical protein
MTYRIGKIKPVWNMSDIMMMPYFYEKFNDGDTMAQWDRTYQNLKFDIGHQADYRVHQPACTQQVIELLSQNGVELDNIGTSYYKMMPGNLLPYHQDQYVSYCQYHSTTIDQVWRAIVFLQDWQPGFLFEIDGKPVTEYSAGTYVVWQGTVPHMAGNLGKIPRYTLQITGTINDKI